MNIQPYIKSRIVSLGTGLVLACALLSFNQSADWGFYAHRLINRMAVYTLPPEMMVLFKPKIDYLSEHAVDPDKRRYATPFEAMRHYIDLEPWGIYPFDDLPRTWSEAIMRHTDLLWMIATGDTVKISGEKIWHGFHNSDSVKFKLASTSIKISPAQIESFYDRQVLANFYEDVWQVPCDSARSYFNLGADFPCLKILVTDRLTEHGILPYHLVAAQNKLQSAFEKANSSLILKESADIGHYIADAHVPLHTTENYNGQLTDQVGIHAFWESRIPELFAETQYDFLVGKPIYIEDPVSFYWDIVLKSHQYVDSVLSIEKELSKSFPTDKQFCFDERLKVTIRTQCREYAQAYHRRMDGMVEKRMQAAIQAVASAWYTAWIDAGQPKFGYNAFDSESNVVDIPESTKSPKRRIWKKRQHEQF